MRVKPGGGETNIVSGGDGEERLRIQERDMGEVRELVKELRERERRERDAELAAYAEEKRKKQPLLNPVITMVSDERVHQTNLKAEKILIPENLTEEERQILRDFYNL